MERVADALGMDSFTFRDTTHFARETRPPRGRLSGRLQSHSKLNEAGPNGFSPQARRVQGTHRGIGLALFFMAPDFTGSGELRLASKAKLAITPTGGCAFS